MTENTAVPPRWALEAALQRFASAVAGHPVALEDIRWSVGQEQAEDAVRELVFMVREQPDKFNTVPLVTWMTTAYEIARAAN